MPRLAASVQWGGVSYQLGNFGEMPSRFWPQLSY